MQKFKPLLLAGFLGSSLLTLGTSTLTDRGVAGN